MTFRAHGPLPLLTERAPAALLSPTGPLATLFNHPRKALFKARRARLKAWFEYHDALIRRDARDKHETLKRLSEWTVVVMRLELAG